jgi:hypothetical protein
MAAQDKTCTDAGLRATAADGYGEKWTLQATCGASMMECGGAVYDEQNDLIGKATNAFLALHLFLIFLFTYYFIYIIMFNVKYHWSLLFVLSLTICRFADFVTQCLW